MFALSCAHNSTLRKLFLLLVFLLQLRYQFIVLGIRQSRDQLLFGKLRCVFTVELRSFWPWVELIDICHQALEVGVRIFGHGEVNLPGEVGLAGFSVPHQHLKWRMFMYGICRMI